MIAPLYPKERNPPVAEEGGEVRGDDHELAHKAGGVGPHGARQAAIHLKLLLQRLRRAGQAVYTTILLAHASSSGSSIHTLGSGGTGGSSSPLSRGGGGGSSRLLTAFPSASTFPSSGCGSARGSSAPAEERIRGEAIQIITKRIGPLQHLQAETQVQGKKYKK